MNTQLERGGHGLAPDTYFASAERASAEDLRQAVTAVGNSSVMSSILTSVGGLMAILNEERQILAVNRAFLTSLGLGDVACVMGLRPGEAIGCTHADDHEAGCGTSRACSTCGAVLAIVACLESGEADERRCALTVVRNGREVSMEFAVRAGPVEMAGHRLVLVFMRDVSAEKRRESIQRTFFHDMSNMLTGLCAASHLLATTPEVLDDSTAGSIHDLATLMAREVEIHRALLAEEPGRFRTVQEDTSVGVVLERLAAIYATHPVGRGQTLEAVGSDPDIAIRTDVPILLRILANLVTNAFEAGVPGDVVRVSAEPGDDGTTFVVWNREVISTAVARRVFQRYFTTKGGPGRGLGTHAVRWLTEELLGGVVTFDSSRESGTAFRVRLP